MLPETNKNKQPNQQKMINTKLTTKKAIGLIGLALAAASANAAIIVDFGNNPSATQLVQTTAIATIAEADVQETTAYTTGTFTTTGAGPVTFDLDISATSGLIIGQNLAFGVNGGSAGLGIDNNGGSGPLEALTFTISDFTGLGAGESLEITGISVLFGSTSESYTINGGSDTNFLTDSGGGNPAEFISVSGTTVSIGAGSSPATAFGIDSITVAVIPEPSSTALLGLGGLALILRRRR
ncbi:MAG: PEP-CTERM sorting domain-containing protein [Verrucomicrobiae bacterium]|nr:PEP-CTERM sorting domain-containing protein [Verrucomicrobiae bacterium]NNJ43617.1 PEP-CTERM sorting domain-containing protein [Akkermansiaceae bacterium]